jgi:hypothetical protein
MYIDWIKQKVSGSPGTGNITLGSAVTGYIALADDSRVTEGSLVHYTIEDGANRERGVGTYSAIGPTLTRTKVLAKIESNIHTESPGTPLTLTSGAVVSCSAVSTPLNHRGAFIYNSAVQSIANTTWVSLTFNSGNNDEYHSTSTNTSRLVVPSGVSKIELVGNALIASNATGFRGVRFIKNGAVTSGIASTILIPSVSANSAIGLHITSPVLSVVPTDYFELQVYQSSGGALNAGTASAAGEDTYFSIKVIE